MTLQVEPNENSGATTAGWLARSKGRAIYAPDLARLGTLGSDDADKETEGRASGGAFVVTRQPEHPSSGASSRLGSG